ncbi:MAG TPA: bifunctional diaminohydroxyphosphoribosylaminopyrimidine deaminase/5-amino-6-(5-phosphoribosylamino)uracil reductase, partial [Coriobacteriia bacterium]|nr:bifunctional diaminohydroxyphosphoribosylaminopyrimidine deaminase/5-amino-6-(5-phosphoribosylamino)uracil reductase [Coriobacteriia bacterium]
DGAVNAVRCYLAPKLFGGDAAPSPVGGLGVVLPSQALGLKNIGVETFDDDICIEGEVV